MMATKGTVLDCQSFATCRHTDGWPILGAQRIHEHGIFMIASEKVDATGFSIHILVASIPLDREEARGAPAVLLRIWPHIAPMLPTDLTTPHGC